MDKESIAFLIFVLVLTFVVLSGFGYLYIRLGRIAPKESIKKKESP